MIPSPPFSRPQTSSRPPSPKRSRHRGSAGRHSINFFPNRCHNGDYLPILDDKKHNNLQRRSRLAINKASGEWYRVLMSLRHYYAKNQHNAHSVILAAQMLLIALRSFQNRVEIGGWAGDFVLSTFVFSTDEMAEKNIDWDNPPGTKRHLVSGHDSPADYLFSSMKAGDEHFARHLAPAFKKYVYKGLWRIVKNIPEPSSERMRQNTPRWQRNIAMRDFLKALTVEHEKFIKKAVIPSFMELKEISGFRWVGSQVVDGRARALRIQTIWNAVVYLHKKQHLTEQDARWILKKVDIHSMGALIQY